VLATLRRPGAPAGDWARRLRAGAAAVVLTLARPAGLLWRALPSLLAVLLLSYGAWLAWPPAGFMLAGALLLADRVHDQYLHDKAGGS
jgi:hypothetical protein